MTGGLQPPPDDLTGFPLVPASRQPHRLYRIVHARHTTTGELNPPWFYSSLPSSHPDHGGRFDLARPRGTCHWSDRRYGAWVEVFRGVRLFDPADARRRRLFLASPPEQPMADLTAPGSYRFGVTAEISTSADYTLPRRWAAALYRHGVQTLLGTCRHDPSSRARNIAVFGPAGSASRRSGWITTRTRVDTDLVLLGELAALGVRGAAVPHQVPTIRP